MEVLLEVLRVLLVVLEALWACVWTMDRPLDLVMGPEGGFWLIPLLSLVLRMKEEEGEMAPSAVAVEPLGLVLG